VRKYLLLLVGVIFLVSCVPQLREPPRLDVDVPQEWTAGETDEKEEDSPWWTRFDDPNLNQAISGVLEKNYDLKAASVRVEAAAALAKIAGADLYPQVSADLSASRQKRNFVGFPFPQEGSGVPSVTTSLYGLSLGASWEIDLWGRIRAARSAAAADFHASQADLAGFRLSIAAQTSKVWFTAVEAQQQVSLAKATLENYRATNNQVLRRYRLGLRPSLDVRFSESNVAAAEAILSQRRNQLQRIKRQLEILLGRYPAATIALSESLPTVSGQIPAGVPADIVRRRPDLVAAEKRLAAANVRVAESRRALYPRISLTGSAGTSSDELKNLLNGDYSVWNIVGNLIQPLFQGGRLRAGIKLAKAREKEVLFLYAQKVLNAYAEVETALSAEMYLEQRESALRAASEQAMAARRLAETRYNRGLIGLIEVLEAQRRAFDSQSQLLNVRRQKLENRVDLYLALGGDFQDEDKGNVTEGVETR
jgi:NodT family efflux transporter outer membrane factor (OMF) lipoprotein